MTGTIRNRGRWLWLAAVPLAAVPLLFHERITAGLAPPPARHQVEIRDMAFHPAVLELTRGDTVVWINRDIVPHTASAEGSVGWDTGTLSQGDSGRFVAEASGEVGYVCGFHPSMQGRLVIR